MTGTKGSKAASYGAAATALGGARQGAERPWQDRLAKFGEVGEARYRQISSFRPWPVCRPAFPAGLCFMGSGSRGLRDVHADHSAHLASVLQHPERRKKHGNAERLLEPYPPDQPLGRHDNPI